MCAVLCYAFTDREPLGVPKAYHLPAPLWLLELPLPKCGILGVGGPIVLALVFVSGESKMDELCLALAFSLFHSLGHFNLMFCFSGRLRISTPVLKM